MDTSTFEVCYVSATRHILLDWLIFFFLLKAGVKLRLLYDESFTGKMTKIFITFSYLKYLNPAV